MSAGATVEHCCSPRHPRHRRGSAEVDRIWEFMNSAGSLLAKKGRGLRVALNLALQASASPAWAHQPTVAWGHGLGRPQPLPTGVVDPGVAETRRPLAAVAFNLVGDAWRGILESRELPAAERAKSACRSAQRCASGRRESSSESRVGPIHLGGRGAFPASAEKSLRRTRRPHWTL